MYRLLTTLGELLAIERWPADFFLVDDLQGILNSIAVVDLHASVSFESQRASITLLIPGELEIKIPGLSGVSLVIGVPQVPLPTVPDVPPDETPSPDEADASDTELAYPFDDNRLDGWTELSIGFYHEEDGWTISLYDLSFELRFDGALLRPVDGSSYVAIGMRGNVHLDDAFNLTFDGFDDFDLAPCQIGNTGLVLSASGVKLDLALQSSPAEILAAGFGEQFIGVYLQSATLQLPPSLTAANGALISLEVSDFILGSGGVSGTLSISAPVSASLLGFTFELLEGSLVLQQNAIAGGSLSGNLTIPFFQDPGESSKVSLTLGMDGNFSVELEQSGGLLNLDIPQVAALQVNGLGFSLGDDGPALLLSGNLQLEFGEPALLWPAVALQNLAVRPDGQIRIAGGWLDLQQPLSVDLFGFRLEISALGFGSLEDERRWIGLSGGLHLIDLLPSGVSVDGLLIIWDPAGVLPPAISLDGVGLELTVPDVFSLQGNVSMTEKAGAHVFNGRASLELLPLGITLDVFLKIGHDDLLDYNFFYAFLDLELPIGIPLWATGAAIYGISGLNGINVLPSAQGNDWYGWYAGPPENFSVSNSEKWIAHPDGQAFGAGMTLGTLFDAGHVVSTKALFALILPGPIILFNGKANLLQLPPALSDPTSEGVFDLLAVLDGQAGFMQLNIDAGWQQGQVMDISAAAEAYFQFTDSCRWHVYLGQKPAEERIRASVLALFDADAYLMIDNKGIAAGFGVTWGDEWKFGPVKASLKSWIEADGAITWQPAQLTGSLALGGEFGISVAGFGASLSAEASLSGKAPTFYWVKGQLTLTIKLPVPLKDLDEQIQLEWKEERAPDIAPAQVTFGLEHLIVDETWKPARPAAALSPLDSSFEPGPVIPLDVRPSLAFDRSMKDETTGVDLTSVNIYAGPTAIGEYQFDYAVKSVRLEKWSKAAGKAWSAVDDLYGAWQAVEDGSGEPAASKLLLWASSPFEFTRQTARLYRDTFLLNHTGWPCVDVPQMVVSCVSWENESLDTSFGPVFSRNGLLFTLEHAAQTRAASSDTCHTRQALWLVNGDTLWVVFPEPVRLITVCLAAGAFLSGQAYAGGVQVAENLLVNGTVTFHAPGMDTLRLNKGLNVFLASLCYETEALASSIDAAQEHLDSLEAGSTHWSSAEEILEPEMWYRLTLELETVRSHNGDEDSESYTLYAGFQTAGPPGLVPTTASGDAPADDLPAASALAEPAYPDGGQLTSVLPYVEWSIPANGAEPVYRAYDLGVDFNQSYVEQMYGAEMGIRLLDRNGLPILDAADVPVVYANQWAAAPTGELSETDLPYISQINACLEQPVENLPPSQKTIFTNGLLFEDDFSSGLDQWLDPDAAGQDPDLNWTVAGGVLLWNGKVLPAWGALLVAGDAAWSDYAVEVELSSTGAQVGLVFRYSQGAVESYYRLLLEPAGRRLERLADHVPTLLWQDQVPYFPGQVGLLGIQCSGSRLRGQVDGELLFDLQDQAGLLAGKVGIYANSAASFERFLVREWPGGVLAAQAQYSAELLGSFILWQGGLLAGWTDAQFTWQEWIKDKGHIAAAGRPAWDDYRLEVNVSSVELQAGLIARFQQDGLNFSCYRLLLNPDKASLRLARLDGTLSGSAYSLLNEDKNELWSCSGDLCGVDFSVLEHTLALTVTGDSLTVELDGRVLAQDVPGAGLLTGQAGLFYAADTPPVFSDLVVRSATAPIHRWSFITSRYEGLVEHLDSFGGDVYTETVSAIDLPGYRAAAASSVSAVRAAAAVVTVARSALAAATAANLADLRGQAQQASASLNAASGAQFEALYAIFFKAAYRPLPGGVELSEVVQAISRLALLVESPEPLDTTRLAVSLGRLVPASGVYKDLPDWSAIWNDDGTRLFLVQASGKPLAAGDYRLHFSSALDIGAEAPLLRRSGSSLPEVAALCFRLA